MGCLTDKDSVEFLRKCKAALNQGGVIAMKENLAQKCFIIDKEDCSIIRSEEHFNAIFEAVG